jgi:hypothetical protein
LANAYSILHNYAQDLYTPDYNLIGSVLQYKQGKLDANRQQLQSVYDQLSVIDVAKGEDREYVERRLNAAKNIANKYAALDLSNSGLTNDLIGKLTETIDDNVKNAVVGTKIYRSEQAAWKKLKEDHPDKYADQNYAYAMQEANKWLNDGTAGTKYNGGGGTIEYRDLSKRILDNVGELSKALKAEYVAYGPEQGYFRSLETHEAVSRDRMEQALNWVFDEKDKQQMGINAWAQYDKMDDAQLKELHDGYYGAKIDNASRMISDIDKAIKTAKTDEQRARYENTKAMWTKHKESLQNNTFDVLSSTYGKETAYRSLYSDQLKGQILDTYTYDNVTDIKVDEIRKANLEFQLKKDKFDEEKRKNREMADLKRKELGLDDEAIQVIGDTEVTPPDSKDNYLATMDGLENQAFNDFHKLISDEFSKSNIEFTEEDMFDYDFNTELANLTSKKYVEIEKDGKKIKIDKDKYLSVINNFKHKILETTPAKQLSFTGVNNMLDDVTNALHRGYTVGGDMSLKRIPNFNFRLDKDKEGNWKLVDTKGYNWYADMITKGGAESEWGKETLKLYEALHMLQDPTIDAPEQALLKDYINNIRKNLSPEEAKLISTDIVKGDEIMPNTSTRGRNTVFARDVWLSDYTKGDIETTAESDIRSYRV